MSILKDLFNFDSDENQLTDEQIMSLIFELASLHNHSECDCAKEIKSGDDSDDDSDDDSEEEAKTIFLKRIDDLPYDASVKTESVAHLKNVKFDGNIVSFKLNENDKSYRMPVMRKDNKSYINLDINLDEKSHNVNFAISESDVVKFDISKADIQ